MQRNQWLWMVPVLLLVVALGAAHLADDAIWFDELMTYLITETGDFVESPLKGTVCDNLAAFPVVKMVCLSAIDNSWPPAYFLLQYFWDKLASFGALIIDRTLALWIGLLAVAVTYRLGREIFDEPTGIIAALLLGTSAFYVNYLHEVRGYTLYVLFAAVNGWLYWRLLTSYYKTGRATRWGFLLSLAGTLYTHYIGIAVVMGIGLYHLLFERPKNFRSREGRTWVAITKLGINGFLLYTPWIAVLIVSYINESLTHRDVGTLTLLNGMLYGFSNNLWWIALPALVGTLVKWRSRAMRFLWTWGLTILVIAIIGNIKADFLFHPRHIMGMMPAFAVLVAAGLMILFQTRQAVVWSLVGLWVGVGMVYSATPDFMNAIPRHVSTIPITAMDTIVETVNTCTSDEDLVVLGVDTPDEEWVYTAVMDYYLPRTKNKILMGLLVTDERTNESPLLPEDLREADYATRVTAFTADVSNVWVFTLPGLGLQSELLRLDNLLQAEDFEYCQVIDRPDLLGLGYTRGASSQCERIVSCAGE